MKKIAFAMLIAIALVFAGCTTVRPHTATGNPIGSKVGEASYNVLFGIFSIPGKSDAGIKAAAANGGITSVSTVDVKKFTVLELWSTYTTIVTGE